MRERRAREGEEVGALGGVRGWRVGDMVEAEMRERRTSREMSRRISCAWAKMGDSKLRNVCDGCGNKLKSCFCFFPDKYTRTFSGMRVLESESLYGHCRLQTAFLHVGAVPTQRCIDLRTGGFRDAGFQGPWV